MPVPPPPLPPHLREKQPVKKEIAWYKNWRVYLGIFAGIFAIGLIGNVLNALFPSEESSNSAADVVEVQEDEAKPEQETIIEPVKAGIGEKVTVDGFGYELDKAEIIIDSDTFSDPRKMLLCTFSFFNESSSEKEFSSMNLYLCDSEGNISGYEFSLDGFTTFPDVDELVAPGKTLTGNIVYIFEEDKAPFTLEVYNSFDGDLVAIFDIPENLAEVELPSEEDQTETVIEDQEIEQEIDNEPELKNYVINSTNGLIHREGSYDAERLLTSGNGYMVQVNSLSELRDQDFTLCGNCFR